MNYTEIKKIIQSIIEESKESSDDYFDLGLTEDVVEESLGGIPKNVIGLMLKDKIGEDSEWIPARLTRAVDSGWYGLFKGNKAIYLLHDTDDKYTGIQIFDGITGEEVSNPYHSKTRELFKNVSWAEKARNRSTIGPVNMKEVREFLSVILKVDIDQYDVKTPVAQTKKINTDTNASRYVGKDSPYASDHGKIRVIDGQKLKYFYNEQDKDASDFVTFKEFDRLTREKANATPLVNMKELGNKIWENKLTSQKFLKDLSDIIYRQFDVDTTLKVDSVSERYKTVSIIGKLSKKNLGIFEYSMEDCQINIKVTIQDSEPDTAYIQFSLGYKHFGGGTNGATLYSANGSRLLYEVYLPNMTLSKVS